VIDDLHRQEDGGAQRHAEDVHGCEQLVLQPVPDHVLIK